VNPEAYLKDILKKISDGHPNNRISGAPAVTEERNPGRSSGLLQDTCDDQGG
jgi:hypothetical protein